jgi:D-alanine-D-alanine ligase
VARVDFRLRDGVPYFLEINPLPGLAPGWSDMVFLSQGVGIDYDTLIRRILDAALARLGLDHSAGARTLA